MFACSRRTGRRTGRRAGRSCQPPETGVLRGGGVSISGLIVHRPCFFGAGIFLFPFFCLTLVEHPTRNEMETLRKVIRFYVEGFREMTVGPVGHHPHQTLHPVRRAESLLLPRPARGQKPLGKGRLRAGKPDTRNSATMNAPVIMQFRPPLAASIPLRGRVAGAGRTRKRGRKPQTRRLRRPGATQTTNQ